MYIVVVLTLLSNHVLYLLRCLRSDGREGADYFFLCLDVRYGFPV